MTVVLPTPDPTAPKAGADDTHADALHPDTASVAERLMAEFEGRLGLAEVTRAVRECWQDMRRTGTEPDTAVLEQCVREELTGRCRG